MADDNLYHFSDEDEDEDALLDRAYDRWEQLGGGSARDPLFQFTMQPIGRRRCWREVVERAQFNAQLPQLRDPVPGDNIGMALTEALHHAIETELDREQRPAHHFANFAITAQGFTHAYQTANFTVGEFLQRTARLDEMLATLAGKLNSNESFNPDRGFLVDVVFVSMPGPGSGSRKNITLVVDAWTEKTRRNNASSPSKTVMFYAVLAPLSPCERTATKIKAWTGFVTGTISSVGVRCNNDKPRNCIDKQGWTRVPVASRNCANFNRRWALNINCW